MVPKLLKKKNYLTMIENAAKGENWMFRNFYVEKDGETYDSLEDGKGMLFDFGKKDIFPNFWMKDMKFAIDIIWINDNRIVDIDRDVKPEPGRSDSELTLYIPPKPIDYVLEVNAGYAERNGIEVGDSVQIEL